MNLASRSVHFLNSATEPGDTTNFALVGRLQWVFPANGNLLR